MPGHIQGNFSVEHDREEKVYLVQSLPSPIRETTISPKPGNLFLNLKLPRAAELVLLLGFMLFPKRNEF